MNFHCLTLSECGLLIRAGLLAITLMVMGCSTTREIQPALPEQAGPPVIRYALSLLGAPYRYGKASPEEGFDCSGFVMHVYGKHGVRLPRTAGEMASVLPPVAQAEIRSGDLVFFNTNGRKFSHVGIFIKGDKFIHAPSQRAGHVLVSSLNNIYWRRHFTGARRPTLD